MTEKELLELLVNKFDNLEKELQDVKQEVQDVKQEVQDVKQEVQEVKQEVQDVKQEVQDVKQEVQDVRQEVKQNTISIETTVSQCLKAYNDGYVANRDKINSFNIDAMKDSINHLDLRQKVMEDELKRIKLKIS